ncbi:MAG: hypothetical protein HXS46_17490 [Theionarchaea archaeon]|nr:MAG: hypothetical protein AYK18_00900 [Theionarchaea archaeon DG-70]MBU7012477.1 hypothetical protein [Theionarchaea archaeon]
MLRYFNLNSRAGKTVVRESRIPSEVLGKPIMTAAELEEIVAGLEEKPEPSVSALVSNASGLVIDAFRLAKDASGLIRDDVTAKNYQDLAEKVRNLSTLTKKFGGTAKAKDASGLIRDASGLVSDASGLVSDASGLVRGTSGKKKFKKIIEKSENLERKARDLQKKNKNSKTLEDASDLVEDASKLVKDASGVVFEEKTLIAPETHDIPTGNLSPLRQVVMYLGILTGVIFSAAVNQLGSGESINMGITSGKLLASAVMALILVPQVYEKLSLNPKSPFIAQFAIFVETGVFWNVAVNLVDKL